MYSKAYIEITNICNMHCSFCHGHHRAERQMSKDEFSRVLDQLQGVTKYVYYHLMGEPLLHPLLPDFLRMAKTRGFKSVITTNGTLIGARGDDILSAGLHKINLSIHSFEEGTRAAHERYLRTLARFATKAADCGTIVVFRLWNRGFDHGKNDDAERILREEITGEWKENTRGVRLCERIFLEWGERFEWPDLDESVKGERFSCYGLKDQLGILSDGTVVPCCLDSEGTIALGNIFREELRDILSSPRATAIVEGFQRFKASEELCKKCGYARRFV